MLVQYRDIQGYIIKPPKIPLLPLEIRRTYKGCLRVQYVWCSRVVGLQHILNCRNCEHFNGTKKCGLNCSFKPAIKSPEYYNQ